MFFGNLRIMMKILIIKIVVLIILQNNVFAFSLNPLNIWRNKETLNEKKAEKLIIDNGQGMLNRYENKNDCFKEAAYIIKNECSKLETNTNDEKTKFAIRLTLCQLDVAKFQVPNECSSMNNAGECVVALSRVNQFWTTYDGFYREVVQMCFSSRYSLEIDLLSEFSKNVSVSYVKIVHDINSMMETIRNEELERLPLISDSLNDLVKDVEKLKLKSESISGEMSIFNEIIIQFQNKITDALSQTIVLNENVKKVMPYVDVIFEEFNNRKNEHLKSIDKMFAMTEDLSIININKLNEINENLHGVEKIATNSLISHEKLQKKILETKAEIGEFLSYSKNEISEFTNHSKGEILKVTNSIGSLVDFFNLIHDLFITIKRNWIFLTPALLLLQFGIVIFVLGELSILCLIFYNNKILYIYGFEIFTHFIAMSIGIILSRYFYIQKNIASMRIYIVICILVQFIFLWK